MSTTGNKTNGDGTNPVELQDRVAELTRTIEALQRDLAESRTLQMAANAAKERLEFELRIWSRAVEQSPASIVITDVNGRIEYVNSKCTQVSGYSASELVGQNPRMLKSGNLPASTYKNLWDSITSGTEWQG
jgi:PAS domain-containing protein